MKLERPAALHLHQLQRPPDVEPEAPPRHFLDAEVVAALLEPLAEEDQACFQVVLDVRQVERRVEPDLAVAELDRPCSS